MAPLLYLGSTITTTNRPRCCGLGESHMHKKHYRIIDETDGSIVANAITTEQAARELAELYSMEYQGVKFTVESYSVVEGK